MLHLLKNKPLTVAIMRTPRSSQLLKLLVSGGIVCVSLGLVSVAPPAGLAAPLLPDEGGQTKLSARGGHASDHSSRGWRHESAFDLVGNTARHHPADALALHYL